MKTGYSNSATLRWTVALLLAALFMVLFAMATVGTALLLGLRPDDAVHLGIAIGAHLLFFLPIWMLLALFLLAPLLRQIGVLRYYSPYLIVSRSAHGVYALHGATPFDYLLLFRWRDRGRPAARRILLWYVDGLLAIARDVAQGRIEESAIFSATSYFFSANNAKRYGFRIEESPRFAIGGLLTYPTQVITYSFARGRWAFPPVFQAKQAVIEGAGLRAQMERLERLREHLRDEPQPPRG